LQKLAGVVGPGGEPRYDLKALRHFHVSELIASGLTPKEIQTQMGHADSRITFSIYGHLLAEDDASRKAKAKERGDRLKNLVKK
jgi:integrase